MNEGMGKHRGPCAEEQCYYCSKYSIGHLSTCESSISSPTMHDGIRKSFHPLALTTGDSNLSQLVGYLADSVNRDLTFHLAHVTFPSEGNTV